jgi:ABC-type sugar transport system substrate-binding protein
MTHLGLAGAEVRVKGMEDVVKEIGSKFEKLALGREPSSVKEALTAYLIVNRDVDAIFTTTTTGTL